MNITDRLVGIFNPKAALQRAQARAAMTLINEYVAMQKRRYEGAAKSRRTSGWRTAPTDANAEIAPALNILRERSRDLVRNDPYAANAVETIVTNTIGLGIMAKFTNPNLQAAWKIWCNSTDCDADDTHDFYGLQALALRCVVESGEVLIRRRIRKSSDGFAIPLQLQVLEPDHLDETKRGKQPNGNNIIAGVEFDPIGRRVAYHLRRGHPGAEDSDATVSRIDAVDVLHLYRCDRPGQVRGVPWAAPVILRHRDFADYEDAYLFRNKLANCHVGVITQPEPGDNDPAETVLPESLEPGAYEKLPHGHEITFNDPPKPDGYGAYAKAVLRAIAAGWGISYEALTGDLSEVNFSSGRMGWIESGRKVAKWQWMMMVPGMCDPVADWFALAAAPSAKDTARVWTPPRRQMINPAQEIPAIRAGIRSGLMSLSNALRETGDDRNDVLAELSEDLKHANKLGLVLDIDASKVSSQGMAQANAPAPDEPEPTKSKAAT